MLKVESFPQLCKYLKSKDLRQVLLFIGNGSKKQYKCLDIVAKNLDSTLECLLKRPVCVAFGGDTFNGYEKPDLGAVVKDFKVRYPNILLLSVQSWPEIDEHIDLVYTYNHIDYPDSPSLSWGGVLKGLPTGGTNIYLSDDWIGNDAFELILVNISATGFVGKQEIEYAKTKGVNIINVDAEPRF